MEKQYKEFYQGVATEQETFVAQGTLILDVMKSVKDVNEESAIAQLIMMLNNESIDISEITVKTFSGQEVTLEVSNSDLEWERLTPEYE
ncbi:hypothetical protein QUF79_14505 [Fictibacillus enclensis]|uniref:hypothetical protein n=1 Tax=Fictibacillus enclensis TaxID=1017270 RepID=UPI0025A1347B|nr:hypothetical protein [Fictibacillus enclensis]MDM5199229.1 hypothetical protein [Fictibacillus enclensis]